MKLVHWFWVLGLVTLLIAVGAACGKKPSPEVVGVTAGDGALGFDYTVWVYCTIRNNGASGNVEVTAELRGGGFWTKRETIFVPAGGEKKVTIAFSEAELFGAGLSGYQYKCSSK